VRHQIKQPEQLIIKFCDGSTMLMFKSGKFRIMGGGVDDLDMHFNIFSVSVLFDNYLPDIIFQTMTATCQFPSIVNLNNFANTSFVTRYNPELFPAVQVLNYKPISVNVFASGKVTICGLKDLDFAQQVIIRDLQQCY
jgi:TATA-box binding protein (TBP) (component of TFIID and TFIIIB)